MNAAKLDSKGPVEGNFSFRLCYHLGVKFINAWYCKSD